MGLLSHVPLILLACVYVIPSLLKKRDDAVRLANPRPPVPAYGSVMTISHDAATMARIAKTANAGTELSPSDFASSFDIYYEAQLDNCDPSKNFVMLGGAFGFSWAYSDIIEHIRSKGYCTLNFDHRSHGRSEDGPGELTVELLSEDAAVLIKRVFKGKPAHVLGWSLGGNIALYLEINHPELVKTATLWGINSCSGHMLPDGECDVAFDPIKWFFSRDYMLRQ